MGEMEASRWRRPVARVSFVPSSRVILPSLAYLLGVSHAPVPAVPSLSFLSHRLLLDGISVGGSQLCLDRKKEESLEANLGSLARPCVVSLLPKYTRSAP